MPFIIQGQAKKREPPAVPFIKGTSELGNATYTCPVPNCGAWGFARSPRVQPDEPDCEHEYPGKCDACDTIVGDRYEELTWMGNTGWLCDRCNSRCEECDAEGVITFCGVCATCLQVVDETGRKLWPPRPVVQLQLAAPGCRKCGGSGWYRLQRDEGGGIAECEICHPWTRLG